MNLDKLKTQYDGATILTIENMATTAANRALSHRKIFIEILFYLERTNRFRENKRFKKATFGQYISDLFYLRYGTYFVERNAFAKHSVEVHTLGIGVVKRIQEKCKTNKLQTVFGAIKNLGAKATKIQIDKIIETHAKPVPVKPQKRSITQLQADLDRAKQTIIDQNKIIAEQAAQVKKLKASVIDYQKKYDDLSLLVGPLAKFANTNDQQPGARV